MAIRSGVARIMLFMGVRMSRLGIKLRALWGWVGTEEDEQYPVWWNSLVGLFVTL